jgi:PmbA protein
MTSVFAQTPDALRNLADAALAHARRLGATDAACELSESTGLSITTRLGKVETIENTRDKGLAVTVYIGQQRGNASTSDFSPSAIHQAVQAAYDIARHTAKDEAAGLPDPSELESSVRDLDLFHPWDLNAESAIEIASAAEDAVFRVSKQIVNSEGASVHTGSSQFVLVNSRGFAGGYAQSRHHIAVTPIAKDDRGMQRDDWYSAARVHTDLAAPAAIGDYAARRALARLGGRQLSTRQCPVLFEAPLACGLLGNFVQAASGGALYRKASFLLDGLGKRVFSSHLAIEEDPFTPRGFASAAFDDEGVRCSPRKVVEDGVLQGYFLSTYSARKLGMTSTGNAGGSHNLRLLSAKTQAGDGLEKMLRKLGTGLFVTELIGMGVDYVNGDYSRGAAGYWVEQGEIAYPVEEITIAGNLKDMFLAIDAIGADTIVRGGKICGSVLIDGMTVGGA